MDSSERSTNGIKVPDDILSRLRNREKSAYNELIDTCFAPLMRFASGFVGSDDTAKDIVQDVIVRILELGERFNPKGGVIPYLYAAVRNRSLDVMRHEAIVAKSAREMIDTENLSTYDNSPDSAYDNMGEILTLLTEQQATAVRLRFIEQRTIPEIARILDISITSTERLLRRAIESLRKQIKAEG